MKNWWKSWGELVQKLITLFGSYASLIGILVFLVPSQQAVPNWEVGLILFSLFLLAVLVFLEINSYRGRKVYARDDTDGIKRYMHRWIDHGGRVAIWSRDLSWADNEDTRNLLRRKASQDELILCLPEQNDFVRELATLGAEVCAYGADRLESPASRFTITSFGRNGARLAVGRGEGDTHVIEEFDSSGDPAFHLAEDLVALARTLRG